MPRRFVNPKWLGESVSLFETVARVDSSLRATYLAPTMLSRLANLIVVLALTFALGGHWIVLQSFAWVSMAARYAQELSLSDAVVKALDGSDPCGICRFVRECKQAEEETQPGQVVAKADLLLVLEPIAIDPPSQFTLQPWPQSGFISVIAKPPLPPPRLA